MIMVLAPHKNVKPKAKVEPVPEPVPEA
jgi:translation initiation factor IF-3